VSRFSTLFNTAALALLAACGQGDPQRQNTDAPRVALLTPGPISDQSWNGGAYAGLLRVRDSLGAQISHVQTRTPAEFEENFRQYGAQGFDVVFGHGFEFQDAAVRVAPDFPNTVYITTSGTTVGPNLSGIRFAFEEPSYLAGLVAGTLTKSNVIGAIGGTELPPVRASFTAFADGARAANPRVRVLTSYLGTWDDATAGKEQALAQITQGVDIIFQNADAAGLGVFQAAREKTGTWVFGSNADQNGVAPEVTLASVVIDLPHAFLTVTREVQSGTFRPRVIELDAATEVVKLVFNPAVEDRIPAALRQRVDSVWAAMVRGDFKLTIDGGSASPP
jgi:basic membrane lipoprotein Med (substrate-binding protein (PBP1-ABC) superfamily)